MSQLTHKEANQLMRQIVDESGTTARFICAEDGLILDTTVRYRRRLFGKINRG